MKKQSGFTLVEVLLAMAIFSFMLLIVVSGFLLVVRQYESVVAMRKAQQNVRYAGDDLSREFRRASNVPGSIVVTPTADPNLKTICIKKGGASSFYQVDASGSLNRYDYPSGSVCNSSGTPHPVTGSDTYVVRLVAASNVVVNPAGVGAGNGPDGNLSVTLDIKVSTFDKTRLDPATLNCLPGPSISFCAVAALSTTVEARGGSQ